MDYRMHGSIIVPLITPDDEDDFFPLIDHVLQGGVKDLLFFGTTGEGLKIETQRKKSLLRKIQPYIQARARLLIGLLSPRFDEAVELANFAHSLDFSAALFPPMLYGDKPEEVVKELLLKTKLPIFLYNPPALIAKSIGDISPFVNNHQIVGIKDSVIELTKIPELVRFRTPSFRIYLGTENNLEKVFENDIDGLVPGSANIFPDLFVRIWQKRDPQSFEELYKAKQYLKSLNPDDYIQALKIAFKNRIVS